MVKLEPTVLIGIVERGLPTARTLASREAYTLLALQAYSEHPTEEARVVSIKAIHLFVDGMRDADWSPEQVVIAIKAVARRAGLTRESGTTTDRTPREKEFIADMFVTAAIKRFYQPRLN